MKWKRTRRNIVVTRRSPWQWVARGVWVLAISVVLLAVISAVLMPRVLGGAAVTVAGNGLAPQVAAGELVVARGVDPGEACAAKVNDVLLYLPKPASSTTALHRVTAKSVGQFPDGTRCRLTVADGGHETLISPEQVRGTMAYHVPKLGTAWDWAEGHTALAFGAVGTVMLGGWAITNPSKVKVTGLPSGHSAQSFSSEKLQTQNFSIAETTGSINSGRHLKKVIAPEDRANVLLARETQIYEHEIALREAKLAHRELVKFNTAPIPIVPSAAPSFCNDDLGDQRGKHSQHLNTQNAASPTPSFCTSRGSDANAESSNSLPFIVNQSNRIGKHSRTDAVPSPSSFCTSRECDADAESQSAFGGESQ